MVIRAQEIRSDFTADTRNLEQGFARAEKTATGFAARVSTKLKATSITHDVLPGMANIAAIIRALPQIGQLADSLVSPLTSAAQEGVRFNMMLENARIGFEGLLGSAEKAGSYLDELKSFAAKTPFEFPDLLQASRYMGVFGFQTQNTTRYLTAWGNAIAATGDISGDSLQGVIRAFGQMRALGRVNSEEMNQLAERGIPAWDLLAKAIGKSVAETRKLGELGKLKGPAAVEAITAMMDKDPRFARQMDRASRTLQGRLSNLQDLTSFAQAKATEGLTNSLNATLASALTGNNEQLVNTMASGINAAITPVANLIAVTAKSTLGGGLTSGITEGIDAGYAVVQQSTLGLARNAILSPFKSYFGIESPSTLMIEQGQNIARGLVVGINDGIAEVMTAGANLSDAVFGGFNQSKTRHSLGVRGFQEAAREATAASRELLDVDALLERLSKRIANFNLAKAQSVVGILNAATRDAGFNKLSSRVKRNQLAYLLATAQGEAGLTSVKERRASPARQPGLYATQNKYYASGFMGRGLTQLTWRDNYLRMGRALGMGGALVANPDLALRPDISSAALVVGSRRGMFRADRSGRHSLDRYINATTTDFRGARAIINSPADRPADFARMARKFRADLDATVGGVTRANPLPVQIMGGDGAFAQVFNPATNRRSISTAPHNKNLGETPQEIYDPTPVIVEVRDKLHPVGSEYENLTTIVNTVNEDIGRSITQTLKLEAVPTFEEFQKQLARTTAETKSFYDSVVGDGALQVFGLEVRSISSLFESSFSAAFANTEQGFGGMVRGFVVEFGRGVQQMAIAALTAQLTKKLFGEFDEQGAQQQGKGGWLSKLIGFGISAIGGLFGGGGKGLSSAGAAAQKQGFSFANNGINFANQLGFSFGGRKAQGGRVKSGYFYEVQEGTGKEYIAPIGKSPLQIYNSQQMERMQRGTATNNASHQTSVVNNYYLNVLAPRGANYTQPRSRRELAEQLIRSLPQ